MAAPGSDFLVSPQRSEMLRTRMDNLAGTSYEMTVATYNWRCGESRLSSRNAYRRRNSQNIRDRTTSAQSQETDRIPFASIPSRCPPGRARQTRYCHAYTNPRASDPNEQN